MNSRESLLSLRAVCAKQSLASLLLALVVLLTFAPPASADGLVIAGRPAGEAGPQSDAAALSPQLRSSQATPAGWQTYTVQPGDTLGGIAAAFKLAPSVLMARNGLANADRIEAGQLLRVEAATAPAPALPADGPLERVQFWPWPPAQGQTLVVWLRTRAPVTVTLAWAGQSYPVVAGGLTGWALIPVPALAIPTTYPLTITIGATTFALPVAVAAGVFETEAIPASASDPILSEAVKVQTEYERMTALFAAETLSAWTPRTRFRQPLDDTSAHTAPFGSRRTYGSSTALTFHAGEDYGAAAGTPVLAPSSAVVVLAEPLFVRGNAVVLDHGRGVFTGYWHLQKITVKAGERVVVGQMLGEVGSTGLSTGPHLHWEMRVSGVAVDPLQWVDGGAGD